MGEQRAQRTRPDVFEPVNVGQLAPAAMVQTQQAQRGQRVQQRRQGQTQQRGQQRPGRV